MITFNKTLRPSISPYFTPKSLHPFHRRVHPQHVGLQPRRLVHPKTAWYSFSFTPSLGLHIAVFVDPLNFEPSGHRFPPNSPPNLYTYFIEGSTLSMSDFNPRRLVHPKTAWYSFPFTPSLGLHIAVFIDPSTLNPPAIDFPLIHPQICTLIS